jgi:CcmD family protein
VSQGEYVAAVYAVVFVVVLVYVAIIAAKLVRLERQTAELLELARERKPEAVLDRGPVYAARVVHGPEGNDPA